MIHNFKVENFYSINEKQELNFTSKNKYSDSYTDFKSDYISNISCFVGANASGKTNVFKALAFLLWFAEKSFYRVGDTGDDFLFQPHKLREGDTTSFELLFDINDILYKYELILTNERIISEILEMKSAKGYSYLYKLTNTNNEINIKYNRAKLLAPINKKDENRFKTKQNATFLSFLIGTGYLEELNFNAIVPARFSNVYFAGPRSFDQISESIFLSKKLESNDTKSKLLPYLKSFDFGIEDFSENKSSVKIGNIDLVEFKHSGPNNSFNISAIDESAGTIKGTYLLLKLLDILDKGGIAIIDELDARLHYDIARNLISLFANKDSNAKHAQLFFSTHQPLFLNDRDKKQIFLCYKENCIDTEIYRLDDVEGVRNTENFFEKYLSGEYGATPRIGKC